VLRKSKPHSIKLPHRTATACLLVSLTVAVPLAAAAPPPLKTVRISVDRLTDSGGQHATEVEPDAAASGSRVVSVFQVGRVFGGGAAALGFAASSDAGRTWHSGLLPLTIAASPAGPASGASDPVVAFDSLHGRWLAAGLSFVGNTVQMLVTASPDGRTWSAPVAAVSSEAGSLDKDWLACDNGATSPLRGRCYLAYTDFAHGGAQIAVQSTADGGATWSPAVLVRVTVEVPGVQLAVRPDGELVVTFQEEGVLEAVRSRDGAATFTARERVAALRVHVHPFRPELLRAFMLHSSDVDASGSVYVAWFDCRFRPGCRANDIVWSRSTAAGRWTAPRRIPLAPRSWPNDFVIPALGVDPRTSGGRARLAVTYYTLNIADCGPATCRLGAGLVTSRDAGAHWSGSRSLVSRPMRLAWLASTSAGRMVGDYAATIFAGGRVVSVLSIARPRRSGRFDQAIHAASVAVRSG
jgi:hypothetical protein